MLTWQESLKVCVSWQYPLIANSAVLLECIWFGFFPRAYHYQIVLQGYHSRSQAGQRDNFRVWIGLILKRQSFLCCPNGWISSSQIYWTSLSDTDCVEIPYNIVTCTSGGWFRVKWFMIIKINIIPFLVRMAINDGVSQKCFTLNPATSSRFSSWTLLDSSDRW